MEKIFRIVGRSTIPGRGVVYTVQSETEGDLNIGDVLFDLQRNRFRISGLEMIRRAPCQDESILPIGLALDGLDAHKVQGDLLIDRVLSPNILFCANPLFHKLVDEEYSDEFTAACVSHSCALFDFEAARNGQLKLWGSPISGLTLYRGWMLTPPQYRRLYEQLAERNIILINTPDQYAHYHFLPNWYPEFESETAQSVWVDSDEKEAVYSLSRKLQGAYIVKDYVKSRKHEWFDACYIPNIQDTGNAEKVIGNFIDRQGGDLIGGVVLRNYVSLKRIGYHEKSGMPISEEYRAFVLAGKIVLFDNYWSGEYGASLSAKDRCWLDSIASRIASNFATVDIARTDDGTLMIMEMGDGQVSGLQQILPDTFFHVI